MSRPAGLLLALLLLSLAGPRSAAAEDAVTAADVSERGRSLPRILDMVLLPEGHPIEGPRTLLFLLDPTASLQGSGFADALEAALGRHAEALGATRIGVLRVGDVGDADLFPLARTPEIVAAVREVLAAPSTAVQNVYADVAAAARELRGRSGRRDLLLVTLENGDAEDDVEGVAVGLERAGIRLFAVGRPAFLSDTYWLTNTTRPPRNTEFCGPESAFVELPWGWLFQQGRPNEAVSSGFPLYGISRLAATTGGKVFVYYPPSSTTHTCQTYGLCPFCTGDHLPRGEGYQSHRLDALAPSLEARRAVHAAALRDPWYGAVLDAWERASKAGLLLGKPPLRRTGAPEKNLLGRLQPLGGSTSFSSHASRADRLVGDLDEILRGLDADLAKIDPAQGSARWRAVADTTRVMLRITRVNVILFAAFCREVGPTWAGRLAEEYELPEIAFHPDGTRFTGVGVTSMSLCHGVEPFLQLFLPGGEAVRAELRALDAEVTPFLERYAHTPYAAVVRRSGLARFTLTVRGKYVPPPKRQVPGATDDTTTTGTDRPSRTGPSGGGAGGGPSTGGD